MIKHLDISAVQAFVYIADFRSFTLAAEAAQTSQSAMSVKLKRLEDRLGCRLIERTPRHVQLSTYGESFLHQARELLTIHDRALAAISTSRQRIVIGISDHVAGPELPSLIAKMNTQNPKLVIEIRIGSSNDLLKSYDRREIDTAIVRLDSDRTDGELIAHEQFAWYAAPNWQHRASEPLPLVTLAEPCGVRIMAGEMLNAANIPWTEVFVGGGVTAVSAAVTAGLGVSALTGRMLPPGTENVGSRLELPKLPKLPIILHTRIKSGEALASIAVLKATFRRYTAKY